MGWTIKRLLIGLGALFTCIMGLLNATESRAKSMDAKYFFSDQQLAVYSLAQQGDTEHLVQATRAGLDLNRPGKEDMTLLGLAVLTAERRAIISLIRAGANANQVIPNVGSPAILAITKHSNPPRNEAIAALLDGGYNPNQLLSEGTPYLFFFIDYNHWPGLILALERGGNINIQRSNGKSLLTYIIERGYYAQAHALILAGADITARGQRGETALLAIDYDISNANPKMVKVWGEMLALRGLILNKLSNPQDRHTVFTDRAERKISENP